MAEVSDHHRASRIARFLGALRRPSVAPALLLGLAAVIGAVAFAYVSDVNDDVDRKDEAAQILSQMETSTARLGNLAALGSEPSLMLHAAGDAVLVQQTLDDLLRRWGSVYEGAQEPPAIAELRRTQRELTRRLRLALGGSVSAGRATTAELVQGDRLYHRIDRLHDRFRAEAADANAAGDTKTAIVTGIAIGFVLVLLALFQFARMRLARMRRDTAMREALYEATRESEQRYRFVTDLVPDQIFTIGPDGRFEYMNERTVAFLGRDREAVNDRWLDLHHPDDSMHVQMTWSNALHAGEPVEVESRMLGADGEYHWILTRAIPEQAEDGSIVRWLCAGTDITTRQQHEQELREARQWLAEAQAIAHIGSWEWDIANDEVRWSDELRRLYGVAAQGRLGYESFLELVHPDDRARVEEVIGAAIAERRSYEFQSRVIRPDGEERVFFSRGHVLTGDDGEPSRLVGISQDITDRITAEQERDRLANELHQAQRLDSIGQLAAGVAHDFNNLLAVILNYANLVRAQVPDAQVQEDVGEIERAAERAARLTRQLLMFGSRAVAQPELLDMNEVVHGTAQMLRGTVGDEIEVELRLAGDLWPVEADRGQLEQVLVNLALNARDAMPSGGVLRIETWNVAGRAGEGPRVRLVVRDSGLGMDPDVLRRALEPFFTTKGAGEGTGLGLATVYGFVKGAGGEVTIDSEPGRGTEVKVELPAVPRPAPALSPEAPARMGGGRILLVDDEEPVRQGASRMLARHGYEVVAPRTAAEALAIISGAAGAEFDLLVTDVVMPHISGPALAARAQALRPALRIVYMSGYSAGAAEAGEELFLAKPFDEDDLLATVREALDGGGVDATA